jgi:hypothetical protein
VPKGAKPAALMGVRGRSMVRSCVAAGELADMANSSKTGGGADIDTTNVDTS